MSAQQEMRIADETSTIISRLEAAGYETWCVGGAVRDQLLGNTVHEYDLATAATPEQVRAVFKRVIPVGVEHGTVGVVYRGSAMHEVTTFRRDVVTDGRHAQVAFGVSLDEDLARRDFTINAIAWHPQRGIYDPFNGQADLEAGIVRAVGVPAQRLHEDRLRIIRALRFAARFNFRIEPQTWEAITAQAIDTANLSAERILDEWVKSLKTASDPGEVARLWLQSGVARVWAPELLAQPPSLAGVTGLNRDPVILTALLGRGTHRLWQRLKASNQVIARARLIDRGPAAPEDSSGAGVRRWMWLVGEAADDLARIADLDAKIAASYQPAWLAQYHAVLERGEATSRSGLALKGSDLVNEGVVSPGPAMGTLLEQLLQRVLADPALNNRADLLQLARELA